MTPLERSIIDALCGIAPELDPTSVDLHVPLRDQVDLDSMDWLRFLRALHDETGVDIPERDYGALDTVADIAAYLSRRAAWARANLASR